MSQQLENDRTRVTGSPDYRGGPRAPRRYPEISVNSIIFGVILGALMNAAITYAGLKIGFTILGSAVAAVLGFGVLRGILRRGSILEVNMAQTIASTVNTTNAGIIFTVPVLMLLTHRSLSFADPNFWWITLVSTAGAVLGCVYIVPLRKQMIDIDRLRFPSSTAVAAILKSPGAGSAKSVVLLIGAVVAMIVYAPTALPNLRFRGEPMWGYTNLDWRLPATPAESGSGRTLSPRVDRDNDGQSDLLLENEQIDIGRALGLPDYVQLVFAIAPLSFGAGYLTGTAGLMVLAGGVLVYLVLNPLAYNFHWLPQTVADHQAPGYALQAFNRPLGIGLLLGGALMGVIVSLPALKEAIKSVAGASKSTARGGRDEMSLKSLALTAVVCLIILVIASKFVGGPIEQGWLKGWNPWVGRTVIALVAGVWIWFAGIIISQCTGMTDWSPISGMALLTVVLVMLLAGPSDVLSAVMLGSALCVAIACSADMMGDLKTGHLIGAAPWQQQFWQVATSVIGPIITMATLVLIAAVNMKTVGVPMGPGTATVAPQAQALEVIVHGVQGGEMPYALYGLGAAAGVLLGIGSFPGLGVLVGLSMYLPVFYIFTYGLGCIANMIVRKVKGADWAEEWGVPFCAGLVVGEATLALIINGIVLFQ